MAHGIFFYLFFKFFFIYIYFFYFIYFFFKLSKFFGDHYTWRMLCSADGFFLTRQYIVPGYIVPCYVLPMNFFALPYRK